MTEAPTLPSEDSCAFLRALYEGAQFALLDQLGRRHHLAHPFWNPADREGVVAQLNPLQSLLARLWSYGDEVAAGEAEFILDEATMDELVVDGLLDRTETGFSSRWRVVTYLQRYFLVTPPAADQGFDPASPVAYIGPESLFFARVVLGAERARAALEVGTGAGLLAALIPADEVVSVELDPFAAGVARFNMQLNGLDHVTVVDGDLLGPVSDRQFDLIVSNPPFLPSPAGVGLPLCGDGGEGGDEVLRKLLTQIPARLTPNGRALVYAEDFGDDEEPNIAGWLRQVEWAGGWDVNVFLTEDAFHERSALRITGLWQLCGASEEAAWSAWNAFAESRPASRHYGFVIEIRRGAGAITVHALPSI